MDKITRTVTGYAYTFANMAKTDDGVEIVKTETYVSTKKIGPRKQIEIQNELGCNCLLESKQVEQKYEMSLEKFIANADKV